MDLTSLMAIPYCPLRLREFYDDDDWFVTWNTPAPNSPRFNRPCSLSLEKESKEGSKEIMDRFKFQISQLKPTIIEINGEEIQVMHNIHVTMLDGKVQAAIHDKGARVCYVCGATESKMMDLAYLDSLVVSTDNLVNALPCMHFWIRSFEYVWHMAIRPSGIFRRNTAELKEESKQRKKQLQTEFKARLGLFVDFPLPGGAGSTIDGNLARRCFGEPETFAEFTSVSLSLIKRLGVVARTLSCGFQIDSSKFKIFTRRTYELCCTDELKWYPLPASVHCVLLHAWLLVDLFDVPLTYLSEEPGETSNKIYRYILEHHARKDTKAHSLEDLFRGRLVGTV
eukprot:Lithocolla_globosa_v1_NODE_3318_length_1702_cov_3.186400.p1 type:complete len:339 gc:universal NODE_3318_length_1702_cov_3.186400:599-1615(+)